LAASERRAIVERCLQALVDGCRDGEWVVRYAVAVGLEALAPALAADGSSTAETLPQLLGALHGLSSNPAEEAPVVQLRARLALQRLGAAPLQEGTDG
jgi:phycocyanobilin lyase beta subunit